MIAVCVDSCNATFICGNEQYCQPRYGREGRTWPRQSPSPAIRSVIRCEAFESPFLWCFLHAVPTFFTGTPDWPGLSYELISNRQEGAQAHVAQNKSSPEQSAEYDGCIRRSWLSPPARALAVSALAAEFGFAYAELPHSLNTPP